MTSGLQGRPLAATSHSSGWSLALTGLSAGGRVVRGLGQADLALNPCVPGVPASQGVGHNLGSLGGRVCLSP